MVVIILLNHRNDSDRSWYINLELPNWDKQQGAPLPLIISITTKLTLNNLIYTSCHDIAELKLNC